MNQWIPEKKNKKPGMPIHMERGSWFGPFCLGAIFLGSMWNMRNGTAGPAALFCFVFFFFSVLYFEDLFKVSR